MYSFIMLMAPGMSADGRYVFSGATILVICNRFMISWPYSVKNSFRARRVYWSAVGAFSVGKINGNKSYNSCLIVIPFLICKYVLYDRRKCNDFMCGMIECYLLKNTDIYLHIL